MKPTHKNLCCRKNSLNCIKTCLTCVLNKILYVPSPRKIALFVIAKLDIVIDCNSFKDLKFTIKCDSSEPSQIFSP